MLVVLIGVFGSFAVVGLVANLVCLLCVRYMLRRRATESSFRPPVTVLRPVCGPDDEFEENLVSLCEQEYPNFEIVVIAARSDDVAVSAAERVGQRYPNARLRIVVGSVSLGRNPKVSSLNYGARAARSEWLLVSDSNVRMHPEYLARLMDEAAAPGVGMVANLIVGVGAETLGSRLENLQLSGYLLSATAAADSLLGVPCVMGKSMLFRHSDLNAIGGFASVADVLAEDFVLARSFRTAGRRVIISSDLLRTVNRRWTVQRYISRQLRWNQLRFKVSPLSYLGEVLATPSVSIVALGLTGVLWGSVMTVGAASLLLLIRVLLEASLLRLTWKDSPLRWNLPWLVVLRDASVAAIWLMAPLCPTVNWRGRKYRLGRDSRIEPLDERRRGDDALQPEAA